MSEPGLELAGVSLRLGAFELREIGFAVAPGEILVLLGANGAGKSVCLETIAGFHRPSSGHIRIAGREVARLPPERRRVGFVVQDFGLFPHLSVAANVALGRPRRGGEAPATLLAHLGIAHLAAARPGHLSPGEKQRAALARALAGAPDVFLFDEPFAALDAAISEVLRDELALFLRKSGVPAVFVTHDRTEALVLADRVAVIEAGAIRQAGPAGEVFARPKSRAIARFLGVENLLDGRVADVSARWLQVCVGGHRLAVAYAGGAFAPGQRIVLCIRAESIRLLPSGSPPRPGLLAARLVGLRRSGPLLKVLLDCGFPLTAHALPQTVRDCALVPGGIVGAEIDADAIHPLAAEPA